MTNNIRVFLWFGLALALWVNYSQWQVDYGRARRRRQESTTGTPDAPKPPSLNDTVPQAAQPTAAAAAPGAANRYLLRGTPAAAPSRAASSLGGHCARHHRRAGARRRSARRHAGARGAAGLSAGQGTDRNRWCCSTRPIRRLTTCCRPASRARAGRARPTHLTTFTSEAAAVRSSRPDRTSCACRSPGPMARASPSPRRCVFHRSMFAIGLEYSVQQRLRDSRGRPPRTRAFRASIRRSNAPCSRSNRSHSAGRPYTTRTARSTSDSTSKTPSTRAFH